MSDEELVRLTLVGRTDAFEELVRRWAGRVTALCHARVGCSASADDVAQETFLRGFSSLASLTDAEKFGAWLCTIASHLCLNWARQRKAASFSENSHENLADDSAEPNSLEREEEIGRLRREVAGLPERYREALRLFYHEELSYREMAEILNVTPAAVNARLSRARQMLRERLSETRR